MQRFSGIAIVVTVANSIGYHAAVFMPAPHLRWLAFALVSAMGSAMGCATAVTQRNGGGDDASVDADRSDASHHPDGSSSGCAGFTGVLATWDFTGQAGSQAATSPTSLASGVTAGSVTRAVALTAVSGLNSINASGWPTTATLDLTKYFAFTLTPPSGCTLDVASLSIDVKSSGTGPSVGKVATSADNFQATIVVSTSVPSAPALAITNAAMLEVRVYGYTASSASGTMRIQNTLTATGSLH